MGITTSGTQQWLFQRIANFVTLVFILVLVVTLTSQPNFAALSELFSLIWFKVYIAITLFFTGLNSVLAGWQIAGDYAHKLNMPSSILTGFVMIVTIVYVVLSATLII